jgi:uncharacterized protein (TIGR00369 family)
MTQLERLQAMIDGTAEPPPVATLVGFRLVAIERGRATFELDAGPQHASPLGTVHGGIVCDVADAAMGVAYVSQLEDDESFTTLELKINFLKPVWSGTLTAVGEVVKAGRTVGLTRCDVTAEDGSLVAHATSTCLTLRGDAARGR